MSEQKKTRKDWLQILKERDYPAARARVGEVIDEYVPTKIGRDAAHLVADVYMPEDDLDLAMSLFPAAKAGKLIKKAAKATGLIDRATDTKKSNPKPVEERLPQPSFEDINTMASHSEKRLNAQSQEKDVAQAEQLLKKRKMQEQEEQFKPIKPYV